jgi:chromosomal replication initiation ATPase DnaA
MIAPYVCDRPEIVHRAVSEVLCAVFPTIRPHALLASDRVNLTTSWLRQAGMYLMSDRLGIQQRHTATWFGRDRTTVMHAVQLADEEVNERPQTAAFFDFLERQVIETLERYAAAENETGIAPLPWAEIDHG